MKYLKKSNSQEEYRKYLQDYDLAVVTSRVNLVDGNLKFFDTSALFYIEAVSDITIPDSSMLYRGYSYDGENWVDNGSSSAKTLTIPAGCRVYLRNGSSKYPLKVTGTYKIGGYPKYHETFADELGLIEVNEDYVCNAFSGESFSGCTNLVKGPKFIVPFTNLGTYQGTSLESRFEGCTSLEEAPIILVGLPYNSYGDLTLDNLFNGCSKLTSEIVVKIDRIHSSATVTAVSWLTGVPLGTLVLSPAIYTRLKSGGYIPSGWKILLSNIDSDLRYINFTIDGTVYEADEGMTWTQWISSKYNTIGLKVSGTNIVNDSGTLYLGETAVLSSDSIHCIIGTDYTINTPTTE